MLETKDTTPTSWDRIEAYLQQAGFNLVSKEPDEGEPWPTVAIFANKADVQVHVISDDYGFTMSHPGDDENFWIAEGKTMGDFAHLLKTYVEDMTNPVPVSRFALEGPGLTPWFSID